MLCAAGMMMMMMMMMKAVVSRRVVMRTGKVGRWGIGSGRMHMVMSACESRSCRHEYDVKFMIST